MRFQAGNTLRAHLCRVDGAAWQVDPVSGAKQLDLLEDERQFSAAEVEQSVTSPDSNKKILEEIRRHALEVGATATLQALLEHQAYPVSLKTALKLEAPLNLRNAATVAGTLVSCDGRSTFTTALLAMDARLTIFGASGTGERTQSLGDYLPLRPAGLITKIVVPSQTRQCFEYVSRTPADKPIVCVAVVQWPSGRTRVAVGGFGSAPRLAMDGTEAQGLEAAARNAFHDATDDWGSADYRMDVAATLATRCLAGLSNE